MIAVSPLTIRITKRTDGGAVLRCVRADGTETWQRQSGHQGVFFPLHDLTHYSVEVELGIRDAFYGLIASGWDIEDTTGQGPRGPIPPEAMLVERIVGTMDAERAGGARWSADEFNSTIAVHMPAQRQLTDDELRRIRARRADLFERWKAVPAGQSLDLEF